MSIFSTTPEPFWLKVVPNSGPSQGQCNEILRAAVLALVSEKTEVVIAYQKVLERPYIDLGNLYFFDSTTQKWKSIDRNKRVAFY